MVLVVCCSQGRGTRSAVRCRLGWPVLGSAMIRLLLLVAPIFVLRVACCIDCRPVPVVCVLRVSTMSTETILSKDR